MPSPLSEPVKLPCGLVLPNRLVKAAMAEQLIGMNKADPSDSLFRVYDQWAEGGWGAILSGNVQVDINHLGTPYDAAMPGEYKGLDDPNPTSQRLVATWKKYADTCQKHGTPAIVQVNHPGRQSMRGAGRRGLFAPAIAPSAIPLKIGTRWIDSVLSALVFGTPREMTQADIERVVGQFADTARLMADCGFSGIELHGAHGYLIDQFLNPKSNTRTDAYGGSAANRAKFVLDILRECRKVVPTTFCIGIKLNSADHSAASFEDTMAQIGLLVDAGIDFLEISGGSYEDPRMISGVPSTTKHQNEDQQKDEQKTSSSRTHAREAFFLEFATETRRRYPSLLLMLTGGFRSRHGAEDALRQNACDLIGLGRPAAINPRLPRVWLDETLSDEEARLPLNKVPQPWYVKMLGANVVGAGVESSYYANQIRRLARGLATFVPAV